MNYLPLRTAVVLATLSVLIICGIGSPAIAEPKAACSIHLGYPAPEATLFYNEMTIEKSTAGSYFMAAGWNTGYFGLQELGQGKKIVLFSVWDPTKGDDPKNVPLEERVECLHQAEDVQIKRFGGEGTGGQCLGNFPWKIGATYRFVVTAKMEEKKTAYGGYLWLDDIKQWKHLVTFRTRTGGQPLKGLYSFVEDFRRDGKSVHEVRRASFSNGWVRNTTDRWQPLLKANFTASRAKSEALETINAGLVETKFFLQTGGETKQEAMLNKLLLRPDKVAEEDHPQLPPEVK